MKKIIRIQFLIFSFLLTNFYTITAQKSTASPQISTFTMDAPQLNSTKKIWVYLPKNYSISKKKFPVIYMHDAQNLFDATTSFLGEWNVDETLDSLNAEVIVIGIEHGGDKRIDELTPFKHKKHGGGNADNYLDFIVKTLKPFVDQNYRTKSDVKNTGLWGSSLGGLVSFYGAIKYPNVFGKIGCFSPAFWFNRTEVLNLIKNAKSFKAKIYFMCGDKEDDDGMLEDLKAVEHEINTKRCPCKNLNKTEIVENGEHNEKLWREGFKKAYLWLF